VTSLGHSAQKMDQNDS